MLIKFYNHTLFEEFDNEQQQSTPLVDTRESLFFYMQRLFQEDQISKGTNIKGAKFNSYYRRALPNLC